MNIRKRINNLTAEFKNIEDREGFTCDEEGRAVINVGAENYDDIFSPYCFKGGDTLSLELIDYLWEKQGAVPLEYDITLQFNVKNASEEKRKEIQAAVKENYEQDIHAIDRRLHRLSVLATWLLIIGAVFMATYFVTSIYLTTVFNYFFDLLSWICIWEGIRALFLDKLTLRLDKLKSLRLGAAKIKVKEFEPY